MTGLIIALHVIGCLFLIIVVLLQSGKGSDMGAAFGGGSNQTLFGSSGGGTFLGKLTTIVAALFMLTSIGLTYLNSGKKGTSSIIEKVDIPEVQETKSEPIATEGTDTDSVLPTSEEKKEVSEPVETKMPIAPIVEPKVETTETKENVTDNNQTETSTQEETPN
ncbi:MAG: preprotein translocase subunit SecG [Desulfobacterales bacterium]|nr:preprotein translocase subunit SecG [Desulfobacterales bacterium]